MMARSSPRILFINYSTSLQGGAERCMLKLAGLLKSRDYNVLVALPAREEIAKEYEKIGVNLEVVPVPRARRTFNPFFWLAYLFIFLRSVLALRAIIKEHSIEIVHLNNQPGNNQSNETDRPA